MNWQVLLYVAAVLIPLAAFAVEVSLIRDSKSSMRTWPRGHWPFVRAQPVRVL